MTQSLLPSVIQFMEIPQEAGNTANITFSFHLNVLQDSKPYYIAKLLSIVLTDGFSSRLYTILRKQRGLIYTIDSSIEASDSNKDMAAFIFDTETKPENVNAILALIYRELLSICRSGLREHEKQRIDNFILTSNAFNMYDLSPSKWTDTYGSNALWKRYTATTTAIDNDDGNDSNYSDTLIDSISQEQHRLDSLFSGSDIVRVVPNRIMQFRNVVNILNSITEKDIQAFVCHMLQQRFVITIVSPRDPFPQLE
jgi:predicted Zn-dependent peptidase